MRVLTDYWGQSVAYKPVINNWERRLMNSGNNTNNFQYNFINIKLLSLCILYY